MLNKMSKEFHLIMPKWVAYAILALVFVLSASAYFPNSQVQADWTQSNNAIPSYIQNKPNTATWDSCYNYGAMWYNGSGRVYQRMKIFCDEITPSSASGNINISSAGFSTILSVHVTAYKSGVTYGIDANATTTLTSVSYTLTQPNTTLVSILGNGVLLGNAYENATTFANIRVRVVVIGY